MIADIIGDTRVLENIGGPRLNMRAQRRIVSAAMRVGNATCPHDLGQLLLSIPLQAFAVGVSASTRVRSCLSYHRRAIANHMRCAVCSHLVPTTCWGPLWTDAFWRSIGAAINTHAPGATPASAPHLQAQKMLAAPQITLATENSNPCDGVRVEIGGACPV